MIRQWIRLLETMDEPNVESTPEAYYRNLGYDSAEAYYADNWREVLDDTDKDAPISEEDQIKLALAASGADDVRLPNGETVYVTDQDVITVDESYYVRIYRKSDWIYDIDPDDYYPDHEQKWNDEFWEYPAALYHATTEENVESILKYGLSPQNKTRGITNRSVGSAVFTTSNYEETVHGSYGEHVFEIDMPAMAKLPNRPFVSQEPPIVEAELRGALAHRIGMDDFYDEGGNDMSPDTVIIHGPVPPQFVKLLD